MENILLTLDLDDLCGELETKGMPQQEIDAEMDKIQNRNDILDLYNDMFRIVFQARDKEKIFNECNINPEYRTVPFHDVIDCVFDSADFGVKKYDCLNFHCNEVDAFLSDYFTDENNSEEIINEIKELGYQEFMLQKYKKATAEMIDLRLKEIQEYVNNYNEIDMW